LHVSGVDEPVEAISWLEHRGLTFVLEGL
jgi:hypothetical protein